MTDPSTEGPRPMMAADRQNPDSLRRLCWRLAEGVTYLNHGSFGPSPVAVQQVREEWSRLLESQPMDFFVRRLEQHLDAAAARLGQFIGAESRDLVFVDNATTGMNIVAASVELSPADEVLLSDHEYGAVLRLWRRSCAAAGAKLVVQPLPIPFQSGEAVVRGLMSAATEKTRLIVVSHVTSPTAVILPVERICREARARRIRVCIDGPHAVATLPLDLERLGCDYYTASCHKWLCGPFGSGFLYVARRRQPEIAPAVVSWGGSVSGRDRDWRDEFTWVGTRDPAAFLAIPAAIEFLNDVGLEKFRSRSHELVRYARRRLGEFAKLQPIVPDSREWYGSMAALPLPVCGVPTPKPGQRDPLQDDLWDQFRIEAPIIHWRGRRFVRVSCHLYNDQRDVDRLVDALQKLLP